MPKEFTISRDPSRGVHVVGWFLDDGSNRMHVQKRQYVPDNFSTAVQTLRETIGGPSTNTQDHWRHVGEIPEAVLENVMDTGGGRQLALNDPERQVRLKRLLNDNEHRDFRVQEGTV